MKEGTAVIDWVFTSKDLGNFWCVLRLRLGDGTYREMFIKEPGLVLSFIDLFGALETEDES